MIFPNLATSALPAFSHIASHSTEITSSLLSSTRTRQDTCIFNYIFVERPLIGTE